MRRAARPIRVEKRGDETREHPPRHPARAERGRPGHVSAGLAWCGCATGRATFVAFARGGRGLYSKYIIYAEIKV